MMLKVKMRSKKLKKKIKNQLILIVQYVQYLKFLRMDWKKNRTLRKIPSIRLKINQGKGIRQANSRKRPRQH